ncbi:MAG: hypothetical protein ACW99U_05700 [Candidatus Thorarchaeota archaeon]
MKQAYGNYRHTRSAVSGLVVWLVLAVLVSTIGPMPVSADVVWSDNFDDLDYDGWTVLDGLYSVEDGVLQGIGSYEYHNIQHNSSVAIGSWSFDVYHNYSDLFRRGLEDKIVYNIMADELVQGSLYDAGIVVPRNGYSLEFSIAGASRSTAMYFYRWTDGNRSDYIDYISDPLQHDNHQIHFSTITITRDNSGHFEIYINGTLELEVDDAIHASSEVFGWSSMPGHAIDNLVIRDDPDYNITRTTTPTATSPTPTDGGIDMTMILLVSGGVAAIIVIVLVVWEVRGRT